ncbi:gas vesicle structural protein GvpA [Streptomyces sp. NPDC004647]|uniref:gas vesicle structural protein GvpA n=1 Tax=Streptomyces sp. NPDC004647 TaxID=3154671 RepID=UPI0033A804B7
MTVMQQQSGSAGGRNKGSLYDVLELILDRGIVIDAFVRVSLVGIEILKIDVRVVIASVDTYLRFAEACNRLDLEAGDKAPTKLTELAGELTENGAKGKSKGALSGAVEAFSESFQKGSGSDTEEQEERRPKSTSSSSSRRPARRKQEEE